MSIKRSVSDYIFSPLVWIQIVILFLLMTLLALVLTPLGPLIGAWAANTFVKEVKIEGVSGSLLTGIDVENLTFDNGKVATKVSDVSIDFAAPDFSNNLVNIDNLSVGVFDILLTKSEDKRQRGELVNIGDFGIAPMNVNVITGTIGQFKVLEAEKTVFRMDQLVLDKTQVIDNQIVLTDVTASIFMTPAPFDVVIESVSMGMLAPHTIDLVGHMAWKHPTIGDVDVEINGEGELQAYALSLRGDIEHPDLGQQQLSANMIGNFDYIDFKQLSLNGDSGRVSALGELAWVPLLSTDLAIDAEKLNAAQFVPEWPTNLTSQLSLQAALTNGKLRGSLDIASLEGTVRGHPLTGSGKVSMLNDELLFDELAIKSSNNTIKVNGRGTEPFDLSWDIDGRDLSSLSAEVAGRLSAKGTLTGSVEQPVLNGQFDTTRLAFLGNRLDSGQLAVKTVDGEFQLDGKLQGLTVNGERIRNATLSGRGDVASHHVELLANHSQASVNVALEGGWNGTVWQGKLQKASVLNSAAGQWRLQKPTTITLSAAGVEADELCMVASDGSACTQINYNDQEGFSTSGKLVNTPLDILNPLLPPAVSIKGRIGGDYNITINPDLKGQANFMLTAGSINLKQDGRIQRFDYRSGALVADIDGNTIKANTSLTLADNAAISAEAAIELSPSDGKHTIDAEGTFTDVPLGLGQSFLPADISQLTGGVSGAFTLKQRGDERVGDVSLSSSDMQVAYKDPTAGIQRYRFNQVALNATLDNDNVSADAMLALRDGGTLKATATVDLSQPDMIKAITAQGNIEQMPLSLARPYLPKAVEVDGAITGDYHITQGTAGPVGEIDLQADKGFFSYQAEGVAKQRYRYTRVSLKATMQDEKILADAAIELQGGAILTNKSSVDIASLRTEKPVFTAEGTVKTMPLAMAKPYLPSAFDVDGVISGDYRLAQGLTGLVGQVDLEANNGFFSYKAAGVARQRYRYNKARLQATVDDDKVLADAAIELQGGAALTSKASVDLNTLSSGKPVFSAEGDVRDIPLDMAQAFLPKGLVVKGRINGSYQLQQQGKLQGKVALDLAQGSVSYDDGVSGPQLYRYRTAQVIADINDDIVNTNVSLALQEGGSFSTKGRLNLAKPNNLYDFEGDGQLKAFPLALLQPYLPPTVKLEGVVEGRYQLTQKGGQQGNVNLRLPASQISILDENGKAQSMAYEAIELNATVNGKSIVADTRIVLTQGGTIDGRGTITLGNNAKSHRIEVDGQLKSVPLVLVKPYLSEDFDFPGTVTGRYQFSQRNGKQAGGVNLTLPNSYFTIKTASGDKQSFAYEDGLFNATVDGNRITVDSRLVFRDRGNLSARAQVMLRDNGSPTINGNVELDIPNIYWAQTYVPYSRGLRGKVVGKVGFSGTVDQPRVTGQVAWTGGYLRLPQVGTELEDINIRILADQSNQARIIGTVNSGGGVLTANGSLSLKDIKNWSAQMSLMGQNIKFVNTHEAEAFMTPNLQITANPQAVIINGTIDIPKAAINLKDVPELSIGESEDVIVIGETIRGDTVKAVRLQPNILVRLGNEVTFKGFGFSTQLVGGLRITNSKNAIVTNGSMTIVDGRYQAYGQDLKIDEGRLVFNGPPKNIGVNVKAVREIEEGEVGIHLTGTLQRLRSTIFSDPILEETDALSYLLTGSSLNSATGRETALLMQAVRGLGIDGSDGLVQRIGKSLGLDDLSIVTRDDFRESELQLGKRLGSKLYVKYLVGIFDSAHRIAVDYKINKYLDLEFQAGEEQSVDLIYEYERN